MRVLVPRRILGFFLLLALLCLIPATSNDAYAKPISYDEFPDPDRPDGPNGDGDGVVVKAGSIQLDRSTSSTTLASGRISVWSYVREYLRLMWSGYGARWYR